MAESLRGGLSLGLSGFGFWSHDIGGFEGMPDVGNSTNAGSPLACSHRTAGCTAVRPIGVPWLFDQQAEQAGQPNPITAVDVLRRLHEAQMSADALIHVGALDTVRTGVPLMRALCWSSSPMTPFSHRQ